MNTTFPLRAIAGCFALACFGVAVVSGLAADHDAASILGNAIVAMLLGQLIGFGAAIIMQRTARDTLNDYKGAHPLPLSGGVDALDVGEVAPPDAKVS